MHTCVQSAVYRHRLVSFQMLNFFCFLLFPLVVIVRDILVLLLEQEVLFVELSPPE